MEKLPSYFIGRYIAGLKSDYETAKGKGDVDLMRYINNVLISATVQKTKIQMEELKHGINRL